MASFKKHCYTDEFWGAKVKSCEYEFEEEYAGEVFDILMNEIEKGNLDYIPNEYEIKVENCLDEECWETDTRWFIINPYEYLTDEEINELERKIKEIWGDGDE